MLEHSVLKNKIDVLKFCDKVCVVELSHDCSNRNNVMQCCRNLVPIKVVLVCSIIRGCLVMLRRVVIGGKSVNPLIFSVIKYHEREKWQEIKVKLERPYLKSDFVKSDREKKLPFPFKLPAKNIKANSKQVFIILPVNCKLSFDEKFYRIYNGKVMILLKLIYHF